MAVTVAGGILRWTAGLAVCAIGAVTSPAQADTTDSPEFAPGKVVITQETLDACLSAHSVKALVPLRGRLPMDYRSTATAEMRANEKVPTAAERAAFPAYLAARDTCNALAGADIDKFFGQPPAPAKKREPHTEFKQLQAGKVTYGEYFRLHDKAEAERIAKFVKGSEQAFPAYENFIEAWLAPNKASYPKGSPWWDFYNYAIAMAQDVDKRKLNQDEGQRLIEARRLRLNEELAAQTATSQVGLNCEISGGLARPIETAVVLDYTLKQVNGSPAEFTETTIAWGSKAANGPSYHNRLNRLSGFITVGTDEFPALMSGRCAPAKKQF